MAKRPNGDGNVRQRTDGRWEARYTDRDGKPRSITGRVGETRASVALRLREGLAARDKGVSAPKPGRRTVGEFLDAWLADTVKPNLSHGSYVSYETAVRLHIKPQLGKRALAALTPEDVRRVVAAVQATGKTRTAGYVRVVLRAALNVALADGLVGRNVAAGKAIRTPKTAPKEVEPMTVDRARRIAGAVRGDRLEGLYLLGLATGARISELLGLRWSDVDFNSRTITLDRQLQWVGGEATLVDTKTRASHRVIPLSPAALDALRAHRAHQAEERLRLGPLWQGQDLVFTRESGGPLHRSTCKTRFQRLVGRAGLGHMDLHDLRHGAATLWIANGADPKTVQELLGHESLTTTLGIYARSAIETKRAAIDGLDSLIRARG